MHTLTCPRLTILPRSSLARSYSLSAMVLLGGPQERRWAGTELLEKRSLIRLRRLEVAHLDVPETPNFLRDRSEPNRDVVVVGLELRQHLIEHALIVAHEPALGPALLRVAEGVQCRSAQEFAARQQPEDRKDPRAEGELFRLSGRLVHWCEQRRREMHVKAQMLAAKLVLHLMHERAVGIEPGHLVLVLVGHQLEQIARDRIGKTALARGTRRLDGFDALDAVPIALGIGRILIVREKGRSPVDHFIQR